MAEVFDPLLDLLTSIIKFQQICVTGERLLQLTYPDYLPKPTANDEQISRSRDLGRLRRSQYKYPSIASAGQSYRSTKPTFTAE